MGLFDLFRSGIKWRCQQCGTVHKSNPEKCRDCGHTVFIQHNDSTKRPSPSSSSSSRSGFFGSKETGWRCSKCRHIHDRKPFVCDECGSSALREVVLSHPSTGSPRSTRSSTASGPSLRLPSHYNLLYWITLIVSGAWVSLRLLQGATTMEWIAIPTAYISAWIVIRVLALGLLGQQAETG